jgi:RimJ/RimL family protein N-acetyltransferase
MWKGAEPKLSTERLHLRAFRKSDLADLPSIDADPDVTYFRGISPLTPEESEKWLTKQRRSTSSKGRRWLFCCIRRKEDNAFLGMTLLRVINANWREWEVGYALPKVHWGKGYASEAVRGTLTFAYGPLNAHRILANTYVENHPSRKLLERMGFRQEAYQLESYFEHGEWQDNVQYALLAREFEVLESERISRESAKTRKET